MTEIGGQDGREPPRREQRSRRQLDRLHGPLSVEIAGVAHPTLDWSLGGFSIAAELGAWTSGQRVAVRLLYPLHHSHWAFDVVAEAVGTHGDGRAGFRFVDLQPGQIEGLRQLRQACISGQLMALENLLAAATPPDLSSTGAAEAGGAADSTPWRVAGLAAIVVTGLAVLSVAAVVLHERLTTLRASHAAVTVAPTPVRMPGDGLVRGTLRPPESAVPPGTVLFDLASEELLAEIDLAEIELLRRTAAVEALIRRRAEVDRFFRDYLALAEAGLRRARAGVAQNQQSLELSERELARMQELQATGHVAQARFDQALQKHGLAEKGLLAARAELDQAQANLAMARSGRFFTGSRVEAAEPARLTEEIRQAEEAHGLQSMRLALLMERRDALRVASPCDCIVAEVRAKAGEWLKAGSDVYLLRPRSEPPMIAAKIPHQDARLVSLGGPAVLRLPNAGQALSGRIEAVSHRIISGDRLGLPTAVEADGRYATVLVALPPGTAVAAGTPAAVAFPLSLRTILFEWFGWSAE